MAPIDHHILALLHRVTKTAILPRYRNLQAGEVEDKAKDGASNDPVTVADREAEAMLREGLETIAPGLAFVGEEAAHADPEVMAHLGSDCWIVDPLDGTRNFASGMPPFGVIVARASGGVTQQGWIFDCLTGRFCTARLGRGAFVDGQRITAQATGKLPPVAAISLIFMDQGKREQVKSRVAPHYRLVDVPWCAAEQYPRLALGTNDVSLFERTLAWDHAAGVLWLNEAGGMAARPDGAPYRVDGDVYGGLIGAASPMLWEAMAERLAAP